MVDFTRIIDVHDRRLTHAKKAETEARIAFENVVQKLQEAERTRDDFLEKTRTQEFDLLIALLNTSVTVNDLLSVEEELKKTQKHIEELIQAINEAQDELDACRERAEVATIERQRVDAKLIKSREIYKKIQKKQTYAAMVAEEREFDEFSTMLFGRNGE